MSSFVLQFMRRYSRFAAVAVLTTSMMLLNAFPFALQEPSTEYQVKAAFLYNFARFVEWPSESFPRPDSPFTICTAGDPFQGALDKTVQGETLDNRPLVARRMASTDDIRSCQILYIALSERRRTAEILTAAGTAPILTVGETDEFMNRCGIIRFVPRANQIHFQINPDAAQRASLKISARLLQLADIVRPPTCGR
jgi:hypothetical protein